MHTLFSKLVVKVVGFRKSNSFRNNGQHKPHLESAALFLFFLLLLPQGVMAEHIWVDGYKGSKWNDPMDSCVKGAAEQRVSDLLAEFPKSKFRYDHLQLIQEGGEGEDYRCHFLVKQRVFLLWVTKEIYVSTHYRMSD